MGELTSALNRHGLEIEDARVPAPVLAALLELIAKGTISNKIAKEVFEALWAADARGPDGVQKVGAIIEERGLVQISDSASIEALVDDVIAANGEQVEQYRAGKQQVLGFLVGQIMKASRGKANPQQVNEALRRKLGG
jgi:aspartyl-tRNA(Asn)/glutamyl-tRNA(Gln) amidotransferase subunit B